MTKKKITAETREQLIARIAADEFGVQTLEARNSDSLDFYEVGVWSIKRALNAAYEAGIAEAKK